MTPEILSPNYDGTWKETIREFLKPMLKSSLPELYAELNLDEPPIFLDNELESLAHELSSRGENTVREVDLLADLPLKNGANERENVRILLHCEVQGRGGKEDLNFRMYRYKSLLELRYNKPIVALAIITEPLSLEQMSGEYRDKHFGTESIYRFNVLKVFEASEDLLHSENPFDIAQLAAARAWRAKRDERQRLRYLEEFVKILNQKGWERDDKYKLLKFLETMAKIRKPEFKQDYLEFVDETKQKEDKKQMLLMIEERAIAIGETRGISIGRTEGRTEGKAETAKQMLSDGVPVENIVRWTKLPKSEILKLKLKDKQ